MTLAFSMVREKVCKYRSHDHVILYQILSTYHKYYIYDVIPYRLPPTPAGRSPRRPSAARAERDPPNNHPTLYRHTGYQVISANLIDVEHGAHPLGQRLPQDSLGLHRHALHAVHHHEGPRPSPSAPPSPPRRSRRGRGSRSG